MMMPELRALHYYAIMMRARQDTARYVASCERYRHVCSIVVTVIDVELDG